MLSLPLPVLFFPLMILSILWTGTSWIGPLTILDSHLPGRGVGNAAGTILLSQQIPSVSWSFSFTTSHTSYSSLLAYRSSGLLVEKSLIISSGSLLAAAVIEQLDYGT